MTEGCSSNGVATAPQEPVMSLHYTGHIFCGWRIGDIWGFIVVFKAHKVRLGYSWLFSCYNWRVGGGEVGVKGEVISECELTTGTGTFVQPLAEDATTEKDTAARKIQFLNSLTHDQP